MKKYLIILTLILFVSGDSSSQDFTKIESSMVSIDSGASRSVNWIDYDNDNDLDLFISTGYRYGDNNLLYRNDNGIFVKISNQPLVRDSLPSDGSSWGDFNNDGFPDLCVVNWWNKINLLYSNLGNGVFSFLSTSIVCTQPSYSETCSWGDYDNDGLIDLFVTNSEGTGHRNFLYKNTGSGNFIKIDTGAAVIETAYSRGVNWVDIDNDRDLDLFVCREGNRNEFLFKNNGNGYFTKITDQPIVNNGGESWSGSWADYDNDGDLDVFITNAFNQRNFLFQNDGDFNFSEITNEPPVTESGYNAVGGWGDYDNDGDLDLFVSQAYVPPAFTVKLVNKLYKNLLIETGNASFQKITNSALVRDSGYTYGFAWGDYDNDGDLDIALANTFNENQRNALYKNEINNSNKWINIKCIGETTNKSAIGTKVRVIARLNGNVVRQMQEVDGQSGYCGQNLILHFGLGNAEIIDSIIVEWPSGNNSYFYSVIPDRNVTISENGSLIPVNEVNSYENMNFNLLQNYPNPFNPVTLINYTISASASGKSSGNIVSLKVFDILGKEVEQLVNEAQNPGNYSVEFNGNNLPGGVYYYTLRIGNLSKTKRMVMLK